VDSPEAWIPQDIASSHSLFRGDIPQDYSTPPSNLDELWFKIPSNSSNTSLNWNDFVHIPSSAGMNAKSLPFNADYLDWDPASPLSSSASDNNNSKSPTSPHDHDTLKGESYSFPRLAPRNIDIEAELSRQNLYKTELCRSWVESASCKYGNKCQFAHGQHELRPVIRHPKYKTEICKTFHTNGTCPYGKRCRFVHNPAELRLGGPSSPSSSLNNSNSDLHHQHSLPVGHNPPYSSLSCPDLNSVEDEELRQLQERFKATNLAPDPVFYPSQSFTTSHHQLATGPSSPATTVPKKGSSLPFFQKLRNKKF